MRVLIVAMANSIHTVRWISQIEDQGWDVHLFPSIDIGMTVHPDLRNTTIHFPFYGQRRLPQSANSISLLIDIVAQRLTRRLFSIMKTSAFYSDYQARSLQKVIKDIKPDIIHTLEMQHAGYLLLDAKKRFGGNFPPWIVTNWGSDIFLFGRLPEHEAKIRDVLANADYYSCECRRDVCLAEAYGFKGQSLPVFPNTGGFDLPDVAGIRTPGPVSSRRAIMLKGYQHWAGRALVGLRALERCADVLKGYTITIYSATPDVEIAAKLFERSTGISVNLIPRSTPHRKILELHGTARISIGLSISDAISTSFLEALVMGAFPIQSWTACADEWIEDGRTGLLVPPEDPDVVELAIRRALSDNELVDNAAAENWLTVQERLDYHFLKQQAIEVYSTVAG